MRSRLLPLTALGPSAGAAPLRPLATAALATAALLASACAPTAAPTPPIGTALLPAASSDSHLPPVALLDLDRTPKSVDAVRAGRVALVTFWATWCDACQREMPALNRLDERATGTEAVVIGVAVGEPSPRVRQFVQRHALRYTQLVDEDFQLTDALGQKRLPATLVLDRSGQIVFQGGALDPPALAALRRALAR